MQNTPMVENETQEENSTEVPLDGFVSSKKVYARATLVNTNPEDVEILVGTRVQRPNAAPLFVPEVILYFTKAHFAQFAQVVALEAARNAQEGGNS